MAIATWQDLCIDAVDARSLGTFWAEVLGLTFQGHDDGDAQLDGQIKNAVESLKLPKAPANIAQQLAGKCKRIPYDFTWSAKGAGGVVK